MPPDRRTRSQPVYVITTDVESGRCCYCEYAQADTPGMGNGLMNYCDLIVASEVERAHEVHPLGLGIWNDWDMLGVPVSRISYRSLIRHR
jgi:hypothetical protein